MSKYNLFLPTVEGEVKNRVLTVNGKSYTVNPDAIFFRTDSLVDGTSVVATYHDVYEDGTAGGESYPVAFTAGDEIPFTINAFFAKKCNYGLEASLEPTQVEVVVPPPPAPPVAPVEPANAVTPPVTDQ